MRIRPLMLLLAAVASVAAAATTTVAHAGDAPDGEPIVFVIDGRRRCVDIPAEHLREPSRVQVWDCTGGANQRFTYDGRDGLLRSATGNCVAGPAQGRHMHTVLVQEPCPPADRFVDRERFSWTTTGRCESGPCDPPQRTMYGVFQKPSFVLGVNGSAPAGAPDGTTLEVTFIAARSATSTRLYPVSGPGLDAP